MLSVSEIDSHHPALDAIFRDPYVARVGHDHRRAAPIHHPDVSYLAAYIGGRIVGAFALIRSGWIETDLHAMLLKDAIKHSRDLGRLCLEYAFREPIERVTAYVIQGLEAAANYCLKLGFKAEGFRRNAYSVGGELRGVYVLGMTRNDWEAVK